MTTNITESFEAVLERQTQAFTQLNKILTNTKKKGAANFTVEYLESRLAMYQETWAQISTLNGYLQASRKADKTKENLPYFTADTMDRMEDAYLEGWSCLREAIQNLRPPTSPPAANSTMAFSTSPVNRIAHIKLPRVELPKFAGDYTSWKSFESRFHSAIIVNETLTDAERLQYLMSSLSGEALAVVRHLEITDANFQIGWQRLKESYDNERVIVHSLLQKLYSLKTIKLTQLDTLNQFSIHYRNTLDALRQLGRNSKEDHIVYFVSSKFDRDMEVEWNKTLGNSKEYPTYATLEKFILEQTASVRMSSQPRQQLPSSSGFTNSIRQKTTTHVVEETRTPQSCFLCKETHAVRDCQVFRSLSPIARFETLKTHRICINCLGSNHTVSNCPSTNVCKYCSERHHTLLHRGDHQPFPRGKQNNYKRSPVASSSKPTVSRSLTDQTTSSASATTAIVNPGEQNNTVATHFSEARPNGPSTVLLATAIVTLFGPNGQTRKARALIDQGSQSSFITNNLVQQLCLKKVRSPISVTGLGGTHASRINYSTLLRLGNAKSSVPIVSTRAFIVRNISEYQPPPVSVNNYKSLSGLELADPCPSSHHRVDVLLGADIYAQVLRTEVQRSSDTGLLAQNTVFGWILCGRVGIQDNPSTTITTHHQITQDPLDRALTRFWETEAIPTTRTLTMAEIECEKHFCSTYSRDADGRFVVRIPFNKPVPADFLGNSLRGATAALDRLTRKFNVVPDLKRDYTQFIREYESLGHMTRLAHLEPQYHYVPHHAVIREHSLTTKLRVVFNASNCTSSGHSLNDVVHTGPKLQLDLCQILIAWRLHKYVLIADIEKMFRQILIHPDDRQYQCILWRNELDGELEAYELNTVTYGTACAPFLAIRVLQELNKLEGQQFPLASSVLDSCVYVDDVFIGASDPSVIEQIRTQTCQLLAKGGFHLRKWAGNDPQLLRNIPALEHAHAIDLRIFDASEIKVLGLRWIPSDDAFYFDLSGFTLRNDTLTKRELLSEIAKLFDPLGWLSPVVVRAKILMQQQWLEKIHWDDPVSGHTRAQWNDFCVDWRSLNQLKIPRWIKYVPESRDVQIHGFSDASQAAYSCAIYVRVRLTSGDIYTTLLAAKSRVAPIKTLTIPVLELNGAVMLAEMINSVLESLAIPVDRIICWTDSTIVLAWLRKPPSTWKTIVANRTSKIHTALPHASWRHVPTRENPADLNSRGATATDLLSSTIWFQGPSWLLENEPSWPVPRTCETEECRKNTTVHCTTQIPTWEILSRVSTWPRLVRIFVYVRRFIDRTRPNKRGPLPAYLTASERRNAENTILKVIQGISYASEIHAIENNKRLPTKSILLPLNPFIDKDGILRVGGRLRNSFLLWEAKHPVILPKHYVSDNIIKDFHLNTLHGGSQLTIFTIRQKYWILGLRSSVRRVIHRCVRCARWRAETGTQIMHDLVPSRCRPSPPFSNIGVDYAGPYFVREARGRGKQAHKNYIAVFICMATRAVHLELAEDASTAAFLAAFDRFTSRRGVPLTITSDNGTNFIGASRELSRDFTYILNSPEVKNHTSNLQIKWNFYPPGAPHHGGMQEAAVRSTKFHLRRIMGSFKPTKEEMNTLLCKVEGTLNSRPITRVRDDPECLDILTPAHFLTGRPTLLRAVPSEGDAPTSHLSRWKQIQKFHELLWKVWSREYLQELQSRYKWQTVKEELHPGDIVLLDNPLLPPNKWELGRISKIFPGQDGHVRVVDVQTVTSTYRRPITRVCRLPIDH